MMMKAPTLSEQVLLQAHVQHCARRRGRMHQLRCLVESIDAFFAPRFVTTLALTLVVFAGAALAA